MLKNFYKTWHRSAINKNKPILSKLINQKKNALKFEKKKEKLKQKLKKKLNF
jgi:hypothetical protein